MTTKVLSLEHDNHLFNYNILHVITDQISLEQRFQILSSISLLKE